MSKRSWLVLGLLLLAAGVLWWVRPTRRDVSVALIFLGYTNQGIERDFEIDARLLVTNKGIVPVKLLSTETVRNVFVKPANPAAHYHLRPGESVIIDVGPGIFYDGGFTRFVYESDGFRDRLWRWVQRSGNANVRKLASTLLRRPRAVVAETGWFASPPLAPDRSRLASPAWGQVPFDLLSTNWLTR